MLVAVFLPEKSERELISGHGVLPYADCGRFLGATALHCLSSLPRPAQETK